MIDVLITAFEPFGGFAFNPTMDILNALELDIPRATVHKHILPVDFADARQRYPQLLQTLRPAVVVNLGLSAKACALTLETTAYNEANDPYNSAVPSFAILENGAPRYDSTVLCDSFIPQLTDDGVPAVLSDDAGRYLCNYVYYHSLHYAQPFNLPALFIHCPFTTELASRLAANRQTVHASLPLAYQVRAIRTICRALCGSMLY